MRRRLLPLLPLLPPLTLSLPLLLGAMSASLGAQDTATLIDRVAQEYRAARTVRGSFEQTLTNPSTGVVQNAHGEYTQGAGSRFALRFANPAGDAIVNDGTSLWLYLPSSSKGQVMKMPSRADGGLDPVALLLRDPRARYVVTRKKDAEVDGHTTAVFALVPKQSDLGFSSATVWIGEADAVLRQVETVEASGLVRRLRFTSMLMNADLPAGALSFTVPPGVTVIDQSALFGKKP